jgi:hypothetical protein
MAADLILLLHFGFIVFVAAGGFLVLRWHRLAWLHVPAVIWGAAVSLFGWLCPLTPLENQLRLAVGEAGYAGSFIGHYLMPVIYPSGLTRTWQLVLGGAVLVINAIIYSWAIAKMRRRKWP